MTSDIFPAARAIRRAWAALLLLAGASTAGAQAAPPVISMEEAVRLAVQNDPARVAADAGAASARANVMQARGAWLPTLTANSIYGNSSNERFDQSTGRLVSQNYTAQLQAGYDIFAGGRRLAAGRSARAGLRAAEAEELAQRFRTVLRAKETFYAAAAAANLLAVAEQRLERARQQQSFAETRFEIGTATTSDMLRAEIEVANAELAVAEARGALRATGLELGRVVGRAEELRAAPAELPDRAPALEPVDVLAERATRSSPAVVAAEATAASRRADRLGAYTPYLPALRVAGGYDWFAFDFPPDQRSWSVRVLASWPLFNGLQREAAIQRTSALEDVAAARARDARIAARVEVETAVQAVELAEERVRLSDRTVALAGEDLRVQEERYQIGAATILDLQASQVALAEAEIGAVRARQALGSAVARLEAILGESIGAE